MPDHDANARRRELPDPHESLKPHNLILLCKCHHKEVDDREGEFTVQKLLAMKLSHEEWVNTSLGVDKTRQSKELYLCDVVDKWSQLFHVAEWQSWSSYVTYCGEPSFSVALLDDFSTLNKFILSRTWPTGYADIRRCFENFRAVLNDYMRVFHEHAIKDNDGRWRTPKFYHINECNEEKYDRLFAQFDIHVRSLENLFFELCRSSNHIISTVRSNLIPAFRSNDGYLLLSRGATTSDPLTDKTHRLEYSDEDISSGLYRGKEWFLMDGGYKRDSFIPMPGDGIEME